MGHRVLRGYARARAVPGVDDLETVTAETHRLETAIEFVLAERGTAVVETEYGKALGGGLYEFRLRWSAAEVHHKVTGISPERASRSESILLRVFFCTSGRKIILLLSGYDKGKGPSGKRQDKEIDKARKLLSAHREAERRGG